VFLKQSNLARFFVNEHLVEDEFEPGSCGVRLEAGGVVRAEVRGGGGSVELLAVPRAAH